MSYILDALERSEAERRRGELPDLLVRPAQPPSPAPRWPVVLGLVLALNLVGLAGLWWLLRPGPIALQASPGAATDPGAGAADTATAAAPAPHPALAPTMAPAPTPALPARAEERVTLAPGHAPAAPQVAVSSHVYSEHPDLRAVTIDGQRLQEGASIRPGLILREITEDGVVVEQEGVLHHISLLDDWGL